jgi:eukaryotic-like serine/threonine-protein kinase
MAASAAFKLAGLTLDGGWFVKKRLDGAPGATGGMFSCGYEIVDGSGKTAFLKALDYTQALRAPDRPAALNALTAAFIFERDLLRHCRTKRMDRIVRCTGDGSVKVDDSDLGQVDYLIFETADADLRTQLSAMKRVEDAWKLRALHHMAIGLNQLHGEQIAHQDLKPSNALVFGGKEVKIADLGCASLKGTASPRDNKPFPGDPVYAPPELLYGFQDPEWSIRRLGCDAYLLGSMAVFLFSGASATALLCDELAAEHRWGKWSGTYVEVLPYVREAFGRVVQRFGSAVANAELKGELETLVKYLCEPDPSLRGHPLNRRGLTPSLSLERFVSKFNLLASRAELVLR